MTNISKKTLSISTFWLTESSKTPIRGSWGTLKPPSDPEQEGRNHQEIEAEGCRILRRWEARATLRLVHVGGALPRSPGRKALPWKRHPCERSGVARWTFLRSEKEKEKVVSMVSGNWHCVENVDVHRLQAEIMGGKQDEISMCFLLKMLRVCEPRAARVEVLELEGSGDHGGGSVWKVAHVFP